MNLTEITRDRLAEEIGRLKHNWNSIEFWIPMSKAIKAFRDLVTLFDLVDEKQPSDVETLRELRVVFDKLMGRAIHRKLNTNTCSFISASSLISEDLGKVFWFPFSENVPFSWGDNDRTLVAVHRFGKHMDETVAELAGKLTEEQKREFELIRSALIILDTGYIDLES